jgi:hypothetical protein
MLRGRYEPMHLFAVMSTFSLAMDPILTPLGRLLDDEVF